MKYEYLMLDLRTDVTERSKDLASVNQLATEGWRIVAVIGGGNTLVLERPKA